ncbi:MmcQ/YjbR family DNA-binding protein [Lactiplantibacillus carotarum]|uniref:MmcQ/YjbR family DNA-binding protein n=1 Tax=Lactiplantibacillus carotarum TaxID=2993456 RepID=UPI00298F33C4|nr:MmcQ/YjbR family DNA-binding protein [Lactiplantibacillus carotarum]
MAQLTFPNKKLNRSKLIAFGFVPKDDDLVYQTPIVDGQFQLNVTVTAAGQLTTQVIDAATQDEYVLHLAPKAQGTFVGQVTAAYQSVINQVEQACFDTDVFKTAQAQALIKHVTTTYADELELLWQRFPQNAVWRRADTHKWYAALLTVTGDKLGLPDATPVTVLDLRAKPADLEKLVNHRQYFPGYHMNKQHWFTIVLDGRVPVEEVYHRLATSYQLAK